VNVIEDRGDSREDSLEGYENNIDDKEHAIIKKDPRVVIDHIVDEEPYEMEKDGHIKQGSNGCMTSMNDVHSIDIVERIEMEPITRVSRVVELFDKISQENCKCFHDNKSIFYRIDGSK